MKTAALLVTALTLCNVGSTVDAVDRELFYAKKMRCPVHTDTEETRKHYRCTFRTFDTVAQCGVGVADLWERAEAHPEDDLLERDAQDEYNISFQAMQAAMTRLRYEGIAIGSQQARDFMEDGVAHFMEYRAKKNSKDSHRMPEEVRTFSRVRVANNPASAIEIQSLTNTQVKTRAKRYKDGQDTSRGEEGVAPGPVDNREGVSGSDQAGLSQGPWRPGPAGNPEGDFNPSQAGLPPGLWSPGPVNNPEGVSGSSVVVPPQEIRGPGPFRNPEGVLDPDQAGLSQGPWSPGPVDNPEGGSGSSVVVPPQDIWGPGTFGNPEGVFDPLQEGFSWPDPVDTSEGILGLDPIGDPEGVFGPAALARFPEQFWDPSALNNPEGAFSNPGPNEGTAKERTLRKKGKERRREERRKERGAGRRGRGGGGGRGGEGRGGGGGGLYGAAR
ncbi:hypothetical protein AAL_06557 [Moelleriella libera RCEF 2490]|uniref:Uncharacterized protein n=1 Tax=Moelleriella libera RCEF 2490 TaxID=1081109 RepID=A0A162IDD8_9HYPO|nr:hypothetical protein AAL_06557 [Moelleriella libera RCEF 2490]